MKTIEVVYTDYIQVEVPDDWDLELREDDIIDLAIEQHQTNPDGTWEIVVEWLRTPAQNSLP